MINCEVTQGHGNGIFMHNATSMVMRNCFIHDNTNTGIYVSNSTPQIYNCIISDNPVYGISNTGSGSMNIFNNIIYANDVGIYSDVAINGFSSNLFWANTTDHSGVMPTGFESVSTTNINVDPCDIYLNMFLDPLCIDPSTENYHVYDNSVCIDAGDPTAYNASYPYDLDGHPRVIDSRIDIGAYEFAIYWEGNINSNWHLPANWINNAFPDQNSDVHIWPDYVNLLVISSNAQVNSLKLWNGTDVEVISGVSFTVSGP